MPAEDIQGMLNAVTVNPDDPTFACPPDGMKGTSTITSQKIVKTLSFADGVARDVWIVQWDHEPVSEEQQTIAFYQTTVTPVTDPAFQTGALTNLPPDWETNGYTTFLITGGVCAYVMKVGESPFPASDGSGPKAPIRTVQLVFGEDVFHDLARVLGTNIELIDTTNALSQQGNCFQGAWEQNQQNNQPFFALDVDAGTGVTAFTPLIGRVGMCPPGTTSTLVKTAENRVSAAKEGFLAMSRVDYSDNRPSSGVGGLTATYQSINNHPNALGRTIFLVLTNQPTINKAVDGTISIGNNASQQALLYPTSVQLNCSVLTGLNSLWAANISRELVAQCFTYPDSKYIAFAKRNNAITDSGTVDILTNVMAEIPMFHPSKSNKNGKFAKMAKNLWKKAAPIIKPIAGIAARQLIGYTPDSVQRVMKGAETIVNDATKIYQGSTNNPNGFNSALPEGWEAFQAATAAAKKAKKKQQNKQTGSKK
jgi:hypothetical protein